MAFTREIKSEIEEKYKIIGLENIQTYIKSNIKIESYFKSKTKINRKYTITILYENNSLISHIYAYDKLDVGVEYKKIYIERKKNINDCIQTINNEIKKLEILGIFKKNYI